MEKLSAIFSVFRQGEAVADPAKWKAHKVTGIMLGAAILAIINLLKAFGHELPIDTSTANTIGAGFVAVVNVVLDIATNPAEGLPAKPALPSTDSPGETGVQSVAETAFRADERERGQR